MSSVRGDPPVPREDGNVLARAVSLNVAGQAAGFAIAFFSSIVLARLLGPADRGLLAVMVVVSMVVLALAGGGLQTATQYYASRKETSQRALLGNNLVYGAVLSLVFVPIFAAFRNPIADLLGHGRGGLVWALAAALVPITFLDFTIAGQLCGRLEFGLWNAILVASRLAILVTVGALVWLAGLGLAGGILATAAGSLVTIAASGVRLLRQEGRPGLDRGLFADSVRYGTRAQVGTLFQFLNFRLDLIVLSFFASLASVGHYAVAQALAEVITYLGLAFQISVLPIISRHQGPRRAETSCAAVRHHGLLALGLVAANAAFAPLVLLFGYGEAFRPALVPLLILIPAMWFMGTGSVVIGDLRGRGRPGLASAIKGSSALVTIALDLALIPRYGITGAAIASLVAYTFLGALSLVVLGRVARVPVRRLVVPTRQDLALYPRAVRALVARLRGSTRAADALAAESA